MIFEKIARAPVRVRLVGGRLKPDNSLIIALGLTKADIEATSFQRRLRGIQGAQERDMRRIEGYVRTRPNALIDVDGRLTVSPKAPADILVIAAKWFEDDELQISLRKIADTSIANFPGRGKVNNDLPASIETGRWTSHAAFDPDQGQLSIQPPVALEEYAGGTKPSEQDKQFDRAAITGPGIRSVAPEIIARAQDGRAVSPQGIHPKIDAWLDAVKAGDPDPVRNKIAATVVSDQEAKRLLENVSAHISDRIRREAALFQKHQAESRQNQLGRVWDRE